MEAIVLAGGLGTRLQTVVRDIPKSMALIHGRPFLEYQLDFLIANGISKVILSVGYKRKTIMEHFKSRYRTLAIDYAIEEEPLGTGGGIRLSFWKIKADRAFVLNGDSLFRIDLDLMLEKHLEKKADITIALRKMEQTGRYGSVLFNRNRRITGFLEKNVSSVPGFINGGIYVINKSYLMEPFFRGKFSMEKDCFERFYTDARFFGFPSEGYFLDIGIPEDYKRAQYEFDRFESK